MVARVNGKTKASNSANSASSPPPHPSPKKPHPQHSRGGKSSAGVPVALTASNFESEVLQSKSIWLVEVIHSPLVSICSQLHLIQVHGSLVRSLQESQARVG